VVQVPEELGDPVPWRGAGTQPPKALAGLAALSGGSALMLDAGNQGRALVGVGPSLPDDFAPVVILDASGRVRPTYEVWEQHRGNLRRLPAANNDYRRLHVHLWQRGSGKVTMAKAAARSEVVNAIAEVINKDAKSRWLIVHFKERDDIIHELRLAVEHDADRRIVPLTWGRHDATNDFADISDVAILGQLTYGDMGVHALACAAAGLPPTETKRIDETDFQWGEFQHHLLQALSRASVRKSQNGLAGWCRALVIATPSKQTSQRVRDTFPNCTVLDWEPVPDPVPADVAKAVAYILGRFADLTVFRVSKAEVIKHLAVRRPAMFSRDLIQNKHFEDFLDREHIRVTPRSFERHRFEPWPGGWVFDEDAPEWADAAVD
jgi:hypothetical protein